MNDAAATQIAKVEIYNLISSGRAIGTGYMAVRYVGGCRANVLRRFDADEQAAREFAAEWRAPTASSAMRTSPAAPDLPHAAAPPPTPALPRWPARGIRRTHPVTPTDLATLATEAMLLSARLLGARDAAADPHVRATLTAAYLSTERVYLELSALRDATAAPPSQEAA